ncbi:alpha/beta hydrolase [Corynebacterium breve]|uniref:Alpha/beta hydrolase n=1 Tax=Corynebacterium breve TaxID=3049799 RepID=A0ABY8VEF0_9CORY|nr:alpha/beta hydrolase [Corynebacterium breve]WIM67859.1 alpha/beta hydrolase [Corynebacterium breve]
MTSHSELQPGQPDDNYPLNEQGAEDFNVGGVERTLPEEQQLEQLVSYMDSTYPLPDFTPPWKGGAGDPTPADRYVALLPDRITHASMLMLGTAVDHAMPGVAFAGDVQMQDIPSIGARQFTPSEPTGRWAISLHSGGWWRGSADALEHSWRPEVAAAAELSGTTILDVDHPLAPQYNLAQIREAVLGAIGYAKHHSASSIAAWGYSSGGALATLVASHVDALVLTFPDLNSVAGLPEDISQGLQVPSPSQWPRTLLQVALNDEIAARPEVDGDDHVHTIEYHSTHRIATPSESRRRVQDVSEFLRNF